MNESFAYYDRIIELLKKHDNKLTVDDIRKRIGGNNPTSIRRTLQRLEDDGKVMHEKMGKTHYYYPAEHSAAEIAEFNRLMKTLDDTVENLKKEFPTYPSHMLDFINDRISFSITELESIKYQVKVVTTDHKEQRIEYEKTIESIRSIYHRHVKNPLLLERLRAYESDSYQVFQEAVEKRIKLTRKRDKRHGSYRKEIPEHIEKLAYIMDKLVYDACRVKEHLKSGEEVPYGYEDTRSELTGMLNNLTQRRNMLQDSLESARQWTFSYRKNHPRRSRENKYPPSDLDEAADKLSEMQRGLKDLEGLIRAGIEKSVMDERESELGTMLTEVEKDLQKCKRNLAGIMDSTGQQLN